MLETGAGRVVDLKGGFRYVGLGAQPANAQCDFKMRQYSRHVDTILTYDALRVILDNDDP
jgi:hypothetical protein